MKKVLIKIFTFILALCCVGLVACNNTEQKPSATLVGFENSTVEISYGMNYNIADYVYDSEGNRYAVSASVTDNDGNAVEADGFFQVLKASYKVVYSVEFGGENKTSTVTVKGISTPVIEFADTKEQTYTIGILPAELPAITASDIIDGTITSITKEVYKQTSFENKKMEDYDGFSNYYMPKELGTYFWKVTVTNSNGQSNTRLLYFYVTVDPGEYDLLFDEYYVNQFKCAKDLTYDYVTNSEIPTEGIINEIGYNGHAYKIGNVPHNASITVPFGYTAKEYIALEQRGMFNAVQFYYMIDSTRHPSRTQCGNNDQRLPDNLTESFNGNYSFFSSAGYYAIKKNAESSAIQKEGRYIKTNEWQVATVPVSDFVKCLGTGKTAEFITTFMYGSSDTVDIYLSDVKFIDYDWTKVPNKGAYDLKINETNFNRVTVSGQGATVEYVANADFPTEYNWKDTVKGADGKVIKDTVLDEFGNPVLDANGNPTTKNRLVEVIGNVKNNVGYAGNAAKVYIPTNNKWVYVNFNYTGNEYLRLEQEGKFNAVKFTVMSESGLNNNDVDLMAQAGFSKASLIKGEWKTYILSIEDFVKAFEDPNTTKATLYRSYLTNGFEHDFYVGNFEFITYDFNHEHTGGTATCNAKAICEICFQEYGDTLPHTEKTPATCTVKAVCDVCGESYGELLPHTPVVAEGFEGEAPTATEGGISAKMVCDVCDAVLSEQAEVPALNYTPSQADIDNDLYDISSKTTVTYSATAPTSITYGENQTLDIDNSFGYAGPAISVQTSSSGRGLVVIMPFTGEQYKAYMEANGYTAVKIWMAVSSTGGVSGVSGTMLNVYGSVRNKWVPVYLTVDQFVGTFGYCYKATATSSNAGEFASDPTLNTMVFRTDAYNAVTWAIHVGTMEFVEYDFNHTHTGGTATCTSQAICEICFQGYGDTLPHTEKTPATCTVKAVCDVCGESYGELLPHTEKEEIPAVNPTATTAGTSAKVVCEVCDAVLSEQVTIPALNYVPAEDNVDSVYVTGQGYSKGYVANADIPTTGIANAVKYNGNAIKIGTVSNAKYIYLTTGYNKADIAKYADANGYTAVKFSIMVEHASVKSLTNNSTAGLIYNVTGSKAIATNKWMTYVATIDQLVAAYENDTAERFAIISKTYQASGSANIYIGSFEFIEYDFAHTHEGGSATCLEYAVCTICGMPYGELAAHTEKVEEEGTLPSGTTAGVSDRIVCELCGTLISEKEDIPALNFNATAENLEKVSDTRTAHVAKEFVENSAIATEGIANPINFAGDAFKMTLNHNVCTTVTLPYTGTELARLADKGAFNAIKFSYMIDPSVDIESITNSKSADNFFLLAGYNGQSGTRLIQNKWVTHVIPAANILDAYADPDTNVLRFFYTYTKVGGNNDWFDFYFSGIEFITIDLEHTCAGGEATCVQKAICSTCGQEYGELAAHVGGTATCEELAICTVCGEGYGELAPHTEKVEIEGTAPTATETGTSAKVVCEVCETVLSEQVTIPALNYVPSQADVDNELYDVSSKTDVTYSATAPTSITYGESQTLDIDNSLGYAGPAISVQTSSSGRGLVVTMPFTGEQYKAYMEANGYNAVKIWMAVSATNSIGGDTGTMLNVFGSVRNKWVPVYLTVDQFIGTFGTMTKAEGASMYQVFTNVLTENTIVYRTQKASSGTWAIHVGTMEFVEYDFDHAHTGGTATCEKLAVCSICYQPYGELAAHVGGTATCKELAICTVCGEGYGELAPHTENVEIEGTKPTGTTDGLSDKLSCLVCNQVYQEQEVLPAYDYIVDEDSAADFTIKANTTATYVANKDFPETFVNNVGYTGDAVMFELEKSTRSVVLPMPYTGDGYAALAKLVDVNAVKFTYLTAKGGMTNNVGLLAAAGNYTKTWHTAIISLEDFINSFGSLDGTGMVADTSTNTLVIRPAAYNSAGVQFYLGNIELIKVADGEVVEHGAYGFTASEETLFNVLDTAESVDYEKSFVANANLPTDGVDNTIGFTGDAVKVSAVPHNATFQIQMAYNANEYTALAAQGKFNAVKFSFMVKTAGDISSLKNNLATNMIGVAGYGRQTKSIEQNTWVTVTISVEDFVGSLDGSNRYQLFKSYIGTGSTKTFDFYFSDIEFVTI